MSWTTHNRFHLLLAASAAINLIGSVGTDAIAANYKQFCPNVQYVDGVYVCSNFATDFQKNCQAAGQQSWVVTVSPRGTPQCNATNGHAFNVVTAPSCDLASDLQRYCAVEPQNGQNWCWTQNVGSPQIPSWVMQSVVNGTGALANCVGQGNYGIKVLDHT
jgi:hypothetical protein